MFEVDWNNQQTFLLNLANLGMGIVVLLLVGASAYCLCLDLIEKWRRTPGGIRIVRAGRGEDGEKTADGYGNSAGAPGVGWRAGGLSGSRSNG